MFNIVLYEPQIPQNTGNIARTCAVTGLSLHLIGPLGFSTDSKMLKRAGLTYWELLNVKSYGSWTEFVQKYEDKRFIAISSKAQCIYSSFSYKEDDFIVFGREDGGLPEEILNGCEKALRIPMRSIEGARCLNLASSCSIIAYEALRQFHFPNLS